MEEKTLKFDYPTQRPSIIKVIGVGGGGGNAVTHMYDKGDIKDVTFALCNTDNQALIASHVPVKIQLGRKVTEGLGAGNRPAVAEAAAEESTEDIRNLLSDGTKMVFVTAGMGGGTGTGAAPIVAKIAKDMDILTIGIVTIPFLFEGKPKILQALRGVEKIRKNVDALLVINNERLLDIYGDMDVIEAFKKADSTLTVAAKSIAEIITIPGHINLDFADVNTTLKGGGVAIMSSGYGDGDRRVSMAFEDALNSPLLNNNDVFNAKKILFNVYFRSEKPLKVDEVNEINDFMARFDNEIEVIWGTAADDESLDREVKVTILATGFGRENIPMMSDLIEEKKKRFSKEELLKEEERRKKEQENAELLDKYYPKEKLRNLGRISRPKPFVFAADQLDDNDIIEAVINNPAYNRNTKIIEKIIADKEANKAETNNTNNIFL